MQAVETMQAEESVQAEENCAGSGNYAGSGNCAGRGKLCRHCKTSPLLRKGATFVPSTVKLHFNPNLFNDPYFSLV